MKEGWSVNGAKDSARPSGVRIIANVVVLVMNKADIRSNL